MLRAAHDTYTQNAQNAMVASNSPAQGLSVKMADLILRLIATGQCLENISGMLFGEKPPSAGTNTPAPAALNDALDYALRIANDTYDLANNLANRS